MAHIEISDFPKIFELDTDEKSSGINKKPLSQWINNELRKNGYMSRNEISATNIVLGALSFYIGPIFATQCYLKKEYLEGEPVMIVTEHWNVYDLSKIDEFEEVICSCKSFEDTPEGRIDMCKYMINQFKK